MKKLGAILIALVLAVALVIPMATIVGAADGEPLVYGMQRNTATIYGINPTDGTVSVTMDTELWASDVGPNGLAYDEDNDIIYWVTYYDANPYQVKLCYWNKEATEYPWHLKVMDGLDPPNYYLPDGDPDDGVTCADFYDGKYYYIPNNTDDLYAVTISRTSDTDASVTQIDVYENISGENGFAWNFGGDIAIGPDGVIYGVGDSTPNASGGPYHFFSVNRDGTGFNPIDLDVHTFSLQLAFALDGTLYGHDSQDDGLFCAVDTANGDLSGPYPNATNYLYTDLASGPRPSIEEKCGDLIAGQHIDVGDVIVSNDGTTLYVTYEINDPDWRITETHLYVGQNLSPTTAPGQFPYDDDDATGVPDTVVTYEIQLDDIDSYSMQVNKKGNPTGKMVADGNPGVVPCNDIYIAAHAVVDTYPLCQSQGIVYGTERYSGDLYQIDVVGGTATMIADTGDPAPTNDNSPNGLAFDPVSGRLYFSVTEPADAATSELYFWDGTVNYSGPLPSVAAGATIYNGDYYYIDNATDDLRKVTFNPNGSVDDATQLACAGFDDPDTYRFGDVVMDPSGPTLFGSGIKSGITPPTFFSVDLGSCTFTEISTMDGTGLQIAYGSNGLLYGCSTGTGEFFIIDPIDGSTTSAGTPTGAEYGFTDLASGELCVPEEETAWGYCEENGGDFPGANWATYLTYHVH